MYLIQGIFKNGNCDSKLQYSYIRNTAKDVVNYINSIAESYECDIDTCQDEEIQIEMAAHWNKKEKDNQESFDALLNCIKSFSYPLSFPYFKLSNIKEDGSIGKPKHACIINDNIYLLKDRDKDGVFHIVSKLV